ncbi:MAG: hypothetical protein EA425_06845 [Puniceicoccaceae bacterium]|nr:MAG: hypothetical protein EA425_06845 [Puniceicoccaceae bacterium]
MTQEETRFLACLKNSKASVQEKIAIVDEIKQTLETDYILDIPLSQIALRALKQTASNKKEDTRVRQRAMRVFKRYAQALR